MAHRLNGTTANTIHADGTEIWGDFRDYFSLRWAFVQPIGEWALVAAIWITDNTGNGGAYRDEYHFLPETWVLT